MKISSFFKSAVAAVAKMISYQPNDPTTPGLIFSKAVPDLPSPCPPFSVQGWAGGEGKPGTLQGQAAQVYFTIASGLAAANRYAQPPVEAWAATKNLTVLTRAGRQLNAYYDRLALRFFYDRDVKTGKTVFTCESADVVAHELGHAILDAMRPDLWSLQALEVFAFHEAFGDITAILTALSHDEVINFIIQETGGNLRSGNAVTRLGEEMGAAIYSLTGGKGGRRQDSLRSAVNDYKYATPEKLPASGPDDQLLAESHNFSRVFTGAWYDALCHLQASYSMREPPPDALRRARDTIGTVFYAAARNAGLNVRFYDSVARAMLVAAEDHGKEVVAAVQQSFGPRGIFIEHPAAFTARRDMGIAAWPTRTAQFADTTTVRVGGVLQVRLADEQAISAQGENPLYDCVIDVPNEQYLEYAADGRLKLEVLPDRKTTLSAAKKCLDHIRDLDLVGLPESEGDRPFVVDGDGHLVRNFICCRKRH